MSLIIDINPVPWEILEQVKARILKNRAKKQKRQPDKGKELRRVMQVDNGILAKQRWEEPSFIGDASIVRIVVLITWAGGIQNGQIIGPAIQFSYDPLINPEYPFLSPMRRVTGDYISFVPEYLNGFASNTFIVDKTTEDLEGTLYIKEQLPDLVSIKLILDFYYGDDITNTATVSVYAFDEGDFLLRLSPDSQNLFNQGIKFAYAFRNPIAPVIRLDNPGTSLIYQGLPGEMGVLEIPLDGSSAVLT